MLESVKNWLNRGENNKYANTIEYAFYLDSFSTANSLYLQMFNSDLENENIDKSLDHFLKVKTTQKLNFKIKKIINQTSTLYDMPFSILGSTDDILGSRTILISL